MLSNQIPVRISVVVPLYNEEENIDALFRRLLAVLEALNTSYEVICVNDGSRDNTLKNLVEYHQLYPQIKVVNLSRNFGKDIAMSAGIDYSQGMAVIPIDADLQDPPELIAEMIEKWHEGYDVVYASRRVRIGESWFKRFSAEGFYQVINKLSRVSIPPNTGDFRLIDRRVVESIKKMPERQRFMKGIFAWVGYKQTSILFDREPRYQGQTKWNYWKLWNFAIDGITSFSFLPLKVWTYVGLIIALVSLVYASFLILRTIIFGIDVPGYASLMVAVLFLGGIQLLTLGIIGEYIGRVYEEVKGRPLYLVRDCYGFENREQISDKIT
ncbi:putative enzyme [Microcystis aeruginosa PCC 9432]|jgi:glycosyltransferase involved in cell wall biosynthesis|uniref:Glycosyltransferase n=3 Tax=Microcystis aeruginosa TaxID=1126 RepID=A0A552DWU3_MICAE|nr:MULTISPECIES: glycosyltransferase family 2 protein [Microcystis]REJ60495.1 MAG: glycosyltransferase [Microcystis aeruginosa DA14]TRT98616.1 MAG: glycosyltransferase [Microcystis aeruginosa Ma_OC_LR_19540900_S633]TRU26696.1 MAG: glycosyltransferase [Microcystis aeruginosa Ma_QC_B_20070730_S2]MCZ8243767.1 glycosyltransferase family 2 protein [Microcystis sp. LE19-131.1A]TYT72554.1 glycosyltransferase family 2 protein [Microcystis aeruginosa KLA2]